VQAADLDGDGDLDVMAASAFDDQVVWFENLGGAVFGPEHVLASDVLSAQTVRAADLDGDGDLDLHVASKHDGAMSWFENLGAGSFGPRRFIDPRPHPFLVGESYGGVPIAQWTEAMDLDGDGDLELLAGSDVRGVYWVDNLGGGLFGTVEPLIMDSRHVEQIRHADLDGDGDDDLAVASRMDARIAWYENQRDDPDGDRVNSAAELCITHTDPELADTDGDGVPDGEELLARSDPTVP
jgi:hypothetical protein